MISSSSNLAENKLKGKFSDFIRNSIRTLMHQEEKYVKKDDMIFYRKRKKSKILESRIRAL